MIPAVAGGAPLFLGPLGFLLAGLLVTLLVVLIARVLFSLAWRVALVGGVLWLALWLVGAVATGPPGLG